MTTYLVMGLVAATVAMMVLFALGNTKGKGKYIAGLTAMVFVMVGIAYFEKDRVAASMLELSVLLASIFLGVLVSKNVLDKTSSYVDELFKDEDKPEPEAQAAEEQPQPKSSSESTNEKYVDLLKKAAKLSIFAVPFLLIVNISMQLILPVVKADDNSVIEHLGTFGDFFGGTLNPVLTFATFIALIATILIQLKELRLTREELKNSNTMLEMSKDEQAKTVLALRDQEQNQRIQQFESTFFKLYEMLSSEQNKIKQTVDYLAKDLGTAKAPNLEDFIRLVFSHEDVNRYFINLFQLLKLVSRQEIYGMSFEGDVDRQELEERWVVQRSRNDEFNKFYYNLVRSMSYQSVQLLLLFNCSISKCKEEDIDCLECRGILEGSAFFEYLDLTSIFDFDSDYDLYRSLIDEESHLNSKLNSVDNSKPWNPSQEFIEIDNRLEEIVTVKKRFEINREKYLILSRVVGEYHDSAFGESKFYKPFLELSQKFRPDLN